MKYNYIVPPESHNYCLCSVLQAILKYHDINFSQKEIADNLTYAETGFLMSDEKIRMFLKSKGLEYSSHSRYSTPYNEPDMLLTDMNRYHGIIGIKNHAYLLESFKREFGPNGELIELVDPKDNKIVRKEYYSLLHEMGGDGLFGLIKRL